MTNRPRARKHIVLSIGGALVLIGGVTVAQTTVFKSAFNAPSAPRVEVDAPPAADQPLVEAIHGTIEIARELRRLALERADHAAVRAFARETSEAGAALLLGPPLLDAIPVSYGSPAPEARDTVARLATQSGPAFDRALMDADIQQRQQLIGLSEQLARVGNNAQLRHVAALSLGKQRSDLARVHALAAEIALRPIAPTTRSKAVTVGGQIDVRLKPKPVGISVIERSAATELNQREMERVLRGQ
jgi:predicted outer membrane protein